jgi:hypothetical protein
MIQRLRKTSSQYFYKYGLLVYNKSEARGLEFSLRSLLPSRSLQACPHCTLVRYSWDTVWRWRFYLWWQLYESQRLLQDFDLKPWFPKWALLPSGGVVGLPRGKLRGNGMAWGFWNPTPLSACLLIYSYNWSDFRPDIGTLVLHHHVHPSPEEFTNSDVVIKCGILCYRCCLSRWVVQTAILKNAFCRVGQETLGMSLWNQGGSGPKKFRNHWSKTSSSVDIIWKTGRSSSERL